MAASTSPGRVAAATMACLATVLVASALATTWWGYGRESEGARSWQRFGPFHVDPNASGAAWTTATRTLGWIEASALLFLAAGTVLLVVQVVRGGSGKASGAVAMLGALLSAAGAADAVVAFPRAAAQAYGSHLGFWGRSCGSVFATNVCTVTRPDLGWYVGAAGGLVGLLGLVSLYLGAGDAEPAAPPARPVPLPAAPLAETGAAPRAVKCPQCQTRVAGARGTPGVGLLTCPNCGLRFPA